MTFIAGFVHSSFKPGLFPEIFRSSLPPEIKRYREAVGQDSGFFISPPSALPEDRFDFQPLKAGPLRLVGDIRLDNRDELIALLGWNAAESRAKADSDLFLAAWLRWGQDALKHLVGGFAVAILDEPNRELTLIRDHVGERPLYYIESGQTIAFASLPSPLRSIPGVDTSLDELRMIHYLAIIPEAPTQTFFKNIHMLPVGHLVTFRNGVSSLRRYWHPLNAPQTRFKSDQQYVEAFRELFDRAVSARLRTAGQVGTQLSGGMDSSSVTATAARLLGQQRLTSFTSVPQRGFSDENPIGRFGDEGPAAALVAAMYPNIDHVLVQSRSEELISALQQMGMLQGHPVFNPTNHLWFKAIMDQSRERGITAILQGACGNATISFGGMIALSDLFIHGHWFKLARLARTLRKRGYASWRGAASFALGSVMPGSLRRRVNRELNEFSFAFSPVHPAQAATHNLIQKTKDEFFGSDTNPREFRRQMFEYYDTGFVNGAASLGWGVSLRDPTQDKRIFEFCFSIPIEQYLVGGQTRSLVRRAMKGRLPDATLACTTRGLQSADWFLTMGSRLDDMKQELRYIQNSPTARRLLDLDRLQILLEKWPADGFADSAISDSYNLALIRGLSAGNFIRHFE
jgi:asparagine synthase (glutamine-hydrolysing)